MGDHGGHLIIIDLRCTQQQGIVFNVKSHERPLRTLAWSPFIPYWIGSGGEDGGVGVWDLRYLHVDPVLNLNAHCGNVSSIAWSPSHCEIFVTSSVVDGNINCWSLGDDPDNHRIYTEKDFCSKLYANRNGQNELYYGFYNNDIKAVSFTDDLIVNFAPHQ